jgi:hypothetical protein
MAAGEVIIQSMWSPAVAAVRVKQIPCIYAPVNIKDGKEGYRGWCNGMGLMKHLSGKKLDAAYEYLNWYMSGWQGAFVSRYGYYSPVPSTAKKYMTDAEWQYWYEGKPSPEVVKDPFGQPMEPVGAKRDGGSFIERVTKIHPPHLVLHSADWLLRRLFPGLPCSQSAAGARTVPPLHSAVLDLEHHPDDFVDPASRQAGTYQFRASEGRAHPSAARISAVLELRGGRGLCASTDDLHDRAESSIRWAASTSSWSRRRSTRARAVST